MVWTAAHGQSHVRAVSKDDARVIGWPFAVLVGASADHPPSKGPDLIDDNAHRRASSVPGSGASCRIGTTACQRPPRLRKAPVEREICSHSRSLRLPMQRLSGKHGVRPRIWLLSVFCRPVSAPGLQRIEIAGGATRRPPLQRLRVRERSAPGRVPRRGAYSIPAENLQVHRTVPCAPARQIEANPSASAHATPCGSIGVQTPAPPS